MVRRSDPARGRFALHVWGPIFDGLHDFFEDVAPDGFTREELLEAWTALGQEHLAQRGREGQAGPCWAEGELGRPWEGQA